MADGADVVLRKIPGTMVLELHGNIDRSTTELLTAAYERGSTDGDALLVVLDFIAADYINSSGIALIVSILARARSEGRRVAAIGLTEHYRHIFDITRLSDFIEVCADLETALESPGARG